MRKCRIIFILYAFPHLALATGPSFALRFNSITNAQDLAFGFCALLTDQNACISNSGDNDLTCPPRGGVPQLPRVLRRVISMAENQYDNANPVHRTNCNRTSAETGRLAEQLSTAFQRIVGWLDDTRSQSGRPWTEVPVQNEDLRNILASMTGEPTCNFYMAMTSASALLRTSEASLEPAWLDSRRELFTNLMAELRSRPEINSAFTSHFVNLEEIQLRWMRSLEALRQCSNQPAISPRPSAGINHRIPIILDAANECIAVHVARCHGRRINTLESEAILQTIFYHGQLHPRVGVGISTQEAVNGINYCNLPARRHIPLVVCLQNFWGVPNATENWDNTQENGIVTLGYTTEELRDLNALLDLPNINRLFERRRLSDNQFLFPIRALVPGPSNSSGIDATANPTNYAIAITPTAILALLRSRRNPQCTEPSQNIPPISQTEIDAQALRHMSQLFAHELSHLLDFSLASPSGAPGDWANVAGWERHPSGVEWRHSPPSENVCAQFQNIARPLTYRSTSEYFANCFVTPNSYNLERYAQHRGFATFYSGSGPAEDFAETAALVLTDPSSTQTETQGPLGRKIQYVRRLLDSL